MPGIPAALSVCKARDVWVVGFDGDGECALEDVAVADQPLAVVLGAEGAGMAQLTRRRCDVLARIDLFGNIDSLNVAVAGGAGILGLARRRYPRSDQ